MGTFKGIGSVEEFKRRYPNAELVDHTGPGRAVETPAPRVEKLVEPGVGIVEGKLVAFIPCVTRSEANESKWTRKMSRKLSAKRAVRETLGPHLMLLVPFAEAYHQGQALKVVLTRLGGRTLDRCNLPTSMKAVEDMIAGALLADDGSPQWHVSYEQEPGEVGVKVEIELWER
jgi:hypothetical protein